MKLLFPSLRGYQRAWLGGDLAAGLTVWAVLVPESLAYASIAGVSPVIGLYAAPGALLLYAALGSSRHLIAGPMSATAAMSAATIASLVPAGDSAFATLTAGLAITTGLAALLAGLLRLGFLANFISEPVIKGFIIGLALTIIVGQLPTLFGVPKGGLFEQLPEATLAAVVIAAVIELVDVGALRDLYRVAVRGYDRVGARPDFIAAGAALLGVLLFDTLPGLFLGISMSLVLLLYRASRPYIATLGQTPGSEQFNDLARDPQSRAPEGVAVLRVESGLYFANADAVRARVLAAADGAKAVVLDAETIPFVDVTAARMLEQLADDLRRSGGELLIARDVGQVRDVLGRETTDPALRRMYPNVRTAVAAASSRDRLSPGP